MKIEVLYPEVANLFGENFGIEWIGKSDDRIELIHTHLTETPAFVSDDVNFVYMGPMPERFQEMIIEKLMPHKERINELIEKGVVFLMVGNAFEIFGSHIENEDGSKVECLKLFNTYAKRDMLHRFNSLYLGALEGVKNEDGTGDLEIIGYKTQFTHSYGDNENGYCFKTLRGCGINPESKLEGVRKNNFFGTYVTGPILVLNPLFTKELLRLAGISDPKLVFEEEAMDVYRCRLVEYQDMSRKILQ